MDEFIVQLIARLDSSKTVDDVKKIEKELNAKGIQLKPVIDLAGSKQEMQNFAKQLQSILSTHGLDIDTSKILSSINQVVKEVNSITSKANKIQLSIGNGDFDTKILAYKTSLEKLGLSSKEIAIKMHDATSAYAELKASTKGDTIIPDNVVVNAGKLTEEMSKLSNIVKQTKLKDALVADDIKIEGTIVRLSDQLRKNTKYSGIAKKEIRNLIAELERGGVAESRLREINVEAKKLHANMAQLGKIGLSGFNKLKNAWSKFGGWTLATGTFMRFFHELKNGVHFINSVDSALTNINYTMNVTKSQLIDIGNSSINMAKELHTSASNILGAVKLYANSKETADSILAKSRPAIMLSNVTGFTGEQSAKYLQTIMNQFDLEQDDLLSISDTVQNISQNMAHDFADGIVQINEGISTSGEVAKAAGMDLADYASMIGLLVEKTGLEGSQLGNSLKTIITRTTKAGKILGVDEGEISAAEKSLRSVGIEVRKSDDEFQNFNVTMSQLSKKWDKLSDVEKSNISFSLAGTRQINVIKSLLENWSEYEDLVNKANEASGTTLKNQDVYAESLAGHLGELKATGESIWTNLIDSETLKNGVDLLNGFLTVINGLTSSLGGFGTIGLGAGLFAGFENIGKPIQVYGFQNKSLNCFEYALHA